MKILAKLERAQSEMDALNAWQVEADDQNQFD